MGHRDWNETERTRRGRSCAFALLGTALAITSIVGLAVGTATPTGAAVASEAGSTGGALSVDVVAPNRAANCAGVRKFR